MEYEIAMECEISTLFFHYPLTTRSNLSTHLITNDTSVRSKIFHFWVKEIVNIREKYIKNSST